MKNSEGESGAPREGAVTGHLVARMVPRSIDNDKENINIYGGGNVGSKETKSPLPVGYPRMPLQDITAVLRPLNSTSEEDDPDTGMQKPFTRSRGLRNLGNVNTTVLPERSSRNANRPGLSKPRKKQVIKLVVKEDTKITISAAAQIKEDTSQHTTNISSSVQLTEQVVEEQKMKDSMLEDEPTRIAVEADSSGVAISDMIKDKENAVETKEFSEAAQTDKEEQRAEPEKPREDSAPSSSSARNEFSHDPKRRKPLSGRSSVSSFR